MQRFATVGILLSRTNYGEADRILTFLTPDHGKVKVFAKGVRKQKSKLAGGIELFSVSEISIMIGRSELNTLLSTRLKKHYGNIVKDLDRTNAGYEMIMLINKATAEQPESAYFELLKRGFEGLDDTNLDWRLTKLWFDMQLLQLTGHEPNLKTDSDSRLLEKDSTYNFDVEAMCFTASKNGNGSFLPNHIKLLRLGIAVESAEKLIRVSGFEEIAGNCCQLSHSLVQHYFLHR